MAPKLLFLYCCILFLGKASAQTASLDFGAGAIISVGFQDEWGIGIRSHYHTHEKWGFSGEYNIFFRRDVTAQNTETFKEVVVSANYKLMEILGVSIFGGLGYTGNNFELNERDPDTSTLYLESGNFNHGAQLKLLGNLPLGTHMKLFAEMNLKSFGRRYDTFAFGLLYSIPMR